MRKDEDGNECPGTLGEYRDLCAAIGGENCNAVKFLDAKIVVQGRNEPVLTPDSEVRLMLFPMLVRE